MNVLGIHSSYVCDDHGFADRGGADGVSSAGASGDAGGSADCAAACLKTIWPDACFRVNDTRCGTCVIWPAYLQSRHPSRRFHDAGSCLTERFTVHVFSEMVLCKLTAVFRARSRVNGVVRKNQGRNCCSRRMPYNSSVPANPKNTKHVAYRLPLISTTGSTSVRR
jgi:hypothetical protein